MRNYVVINEPHWKDNIVQICDISETYEEAKSYLDDGTYSPEHSKQKVFIINKAQIDSGEYIVKT